MTIQINTDHNAHLSANSREEFSATIKDALSRFSEQITRIEVHFTDENGPKEGLNDKKCLIEARLEGLQPIVATNHGNDFSHSLDGALVTLKANLGKIKEKLSNH